MIFIRSDVSARWSTVIWLGGAFSLGFFLLLRLFPSYFANLHPAWVPLSAIFAALLLLLVFSTYFLASKKISVPVKFILLFFGTFIFFSLIHFPTLSSWGGDYAHYILEAQALRDGTMEELGQRIVHMRNSDTLHQWIVPQYPPVGFPYMLRTAMLLGIETPVYLCWIPLTCMALLTSLIWLGFHRTIDGYFIFLFLFYTVFNSYALEIAFQPLSDIPFLCVSCSALLLMNFLYCRQSVSGAKRIFSICLMFLLCCFSIMIRSGGMILIPCIVLVQIYDFFASEKNKRIRIFSEFFILLIAIAGFFLWQRKVFPNSNEGIFFTALQACSWEQFFSNLSYYYRFSVRISPFGRNLLSYLLFWFFLLCAVISLKYRYRSHANLICWVFFNFFPLLLLHFRDPRYLLPVLPFYLLAASDGAMILWRNKKSFLLLLGEKAATFLSYAFFTFFILLIICNCYCCADFIYHGQLKVFTDPQPNDTPMSDSAQQAFAFLSQHCAETEQIGCFKPRTFYLFTKRDCVYHMFPIPLGRCHHYCLMRKDMKRANASIEMILAQYPDYCVSFQNNCCVIFSKKLPMREKAGEVAPDGVEEAVSASQVKDSTF